MYNIVQCILRYPEVFPTSFPTPNFPKQIFRHQIFRHLHFPTVKFSDRKFFRIIQPNSLTSHFTLYAVEECSANCIPRYLHIYATFSTFSIANIVLWYETVVLWCSTLNPSVLWCCNSLLKPHGKEIHIFYCKHAGFTRGEMSVAAPSFHLGGTALREED